MNFIWTKHTWGEQHLKLGTQSYGEIIDNFFAQESNKLEETCGAENIATDWKVQATVRSVALDIVKSTPNDADLGTCTHTSEKCNLSEVEQESLMGSLVQAYSLRFLGGKIRGEEIPTCQLILAQTTFLKKLNAGNQAALLDGVGGEIGESEGIPRI